jgi:uncharacterized membrane protein YagU involved in acid resistance
MNFMMIMLINGTLFELAQGGSKDPLNALQYSYAHRNLIMSNLIPYLFLYVLIIGFVSVLLQFAFPSLNSKQSIVIGMLVNILYNHPH